MPHSRSYSEIHPQPTYTGYQRRASSDMSANVNGIHSNMSVFIIGFLLYDFRRFPSI